MFLAWKKMGTWAQIQLQNEQTSYSHCTNESDDEIFEEQLLEKNCEENQGQEELTTQVPAQAIQGRPSANNISILKIMIGLKPIVALVDTGTTGTFISSKLAMKNGCVEKGEKPMRVTQLPMERIYVEQGCLPRMPVHRARL